MTRVGAGWGLARQDKCSAPWISAIRLPLKLVDPEDEGDLADNGGCDGGEQGEGEGVARHFARFGCGVCGSFGALIRRGEAAGGGEAVEVACDVAHFYHFVEKRGINTANDSRKQGLFGGC